MKSFLKFLFRFSFLLAAVVLVVCFHEPLKKGWKKLTGRHDTQSAQAALSDETEAIEDKKRETLFEDGVSRYAYSQLSKEEQEIYLLFLEGITDMETSFEVSSVDTDTLDMIYDSLLADHPEIFWTDGYTVTSYMWGDLVHSLTVEPSYTCDKAKRDAYAALVEETADSIVSEARSLYESDYARVKHIYETLIHMVEYDPYADNNQNICSVFLLKRSVCMGYAKSFQYLLQKLGMECTTVSGYADSRSHAWNLVLMDGEYYYVDPTWGDTNYSDPGKNRDDVNYVYFGMTTEEIDRTHQSNAAFTLPECSASADNYYVREGLLFDRFEQSVIGGLIWDTQESGASEVTFRFTNRQAYEEAFAHLMEDNKVFDYCQGTENISYRNDEIYLTMTIYYH